MKSAERRNFKLKHHISNLKYRELRNFCLQYNEKKKEIQYGLSSVVADGMPRGNATSNPTESMAIRNEMLRKDMELIEQTAIEADSSLYQYILKNVTEGVAYEYMDIPAGKSTFYEARRMFFYLLAQKR